MERFDCGGYLNIITDERDLTQVNVTLTHATAHTRYAERPDDLPLEDTPWLLDTADLDQTLQMESDQARSMMDSLNAGTSHHQRTAHLTEGIQMPMDASGGDHLMHMNMDPTLQEAGTGAVNGMQTLNGAHQTMTPDGGMPLPTLLSMPNQATSRLPANFDPALLNASLQATGPSITQDMSSNTSLAIAVSRAPGQVLQSGQGQQKGNVSGSDRVRIFPYEFHLC
jgi:hypothetical protein